MVPSAGLEPATSSLGGRRSIQMSYEGKMKLALYSTKARNKALIHCRRGYASYRWAGACSILAGYRQVGGTIGVRQLCLTNPMGQQE